MSEYRLIPLSGKKGQGMYAKVSPEDYDYLNQFYWNLDTGGYVSTGPQPEITGSPYRATMHVLVALRMGLIAEVGRYLVPDHRNQDRLDNCRGNLRPATMSQNRMNTSLQANNQTGFMGVCRTPDNETYTVYVNDGDVQHHVSPFESLEEAARVRDALARFYYGEFARTNFEGTEAYDVQTARRNLRASRSMSSRFRNVYKYKGFRKWAARVQINGVKKHVGMFDTEVEAAKAVDECRIKHGLLPLNFPV